MSNEFSIFMFGIQFYWVLKFVVICFQKPNPSLCWPDPWGCSTTQATLTEAVDPFQLTTDTACKQTSPRVRPVKTTWHVKKKRKQTAAKNSKVVSSRNRFRFFLLFTLFFVQIFMFVRLLIFGCLESLVDNTIAIYLNYFGWKKKNRKLTLWPCADV